MTGKRLALERVRVAYGGAVAVDGVSLAVEPGEVVALLGPNGAGKSSLLRAVMGLVPAEGRMALGGVPLHGLATEARAARGLAYVPEGRRVFPGLTARENLEVAARAGAAERMRRLDDVHALFPDLRLVAATPAWRLSGGQQQMLAIGRALMQAPSALLLDEPSLGLAPRLAADLYARLARIRESGAAILLAEQSPALALGLADRVGLMARGRLMLLAPAASLTADEILARAFLDGGGRGDA